MTDEIRVGVIGIAREEIRAALGRAGIVTVPTSDVDAATRLLSGDLDYVVGACESGGGAALAIPIALVGAERCRNLSRMGRPAGQDEIRNLLAQGVRAFGVARDHIGSVVSALGRELGRTEAADLV